MAQEAGEIPRETSKRREGDERFPQYVLSKPYQFISEQSLREREKNFKPLDLEGLGEKGFLCFPTRELKSGNREMKGWWVVKKDPDAIANYLKKVGAELDLQAGLIVAPPEKMGQIIGKGGKNLEQLRQVLEADYRAKNPDKKFPGLWVVENSLKGISEYLERRFGAEFMFESGIIKVPKDQVYRIKSKPHLACLQKILQGIWEKKHPGKTYHNLVVGKA